MNSKDPDLLKSDMVEKLLKGSLEATQSVIPIEWLRDKDRDGIADGLELKVYDDLTTMGGTSMDYDRDGIPDFVEKYMYGRYAVDNQINYLNVVNDWNDTIDLTGLSKVSNGKRDMEDLDRDGLPDDFERRLSPDNSLDTYNTESEALVKIMESGNWDGMSVAYSLVDTDADGVSDDLERFLYGTYQDLQLNIIDTNVGLDGDFDNDGIYDLVEHLIYLYSDNMAKYIESISINSTMLDKGSYVDKIVESVSPGLDIENIIDVLKTIDVYNDYSGNTIGLQMYLMSAVDFNSTLYDTIRDIQATSSTPMSSFIDALSTKLTKNLTSNETMIRDLITLFAGVDIDKIHNGSSVYYDAERLRRNLLEISGARINGELYELLYHISANDEEEAKKQFIQDLRNRSKNGVLSEQKRKKLIITLNKIYLDSFETVEDLRDEIIRLDRDISRLTNNMDNDGVEDIVEACSLPQA